RIPTFFTLHCTTPPAEKRGRLERRLQQRLPAPRHTSNLLFPRRIMLRESIAAVVVSKDPSMFADSGPGLKRDAPCMAILWYVTTQLEHAGTGHIGPCAGHSLFARGGGNPVGLPRHAERAREFGSGPAMARIRGA